MLPFWQNVRGGSMLPALRDGDEVLLEPPGSFTVGDVVVVRIPSLPRAVLHRIVALDGGRVTTRGDACRRSDPPSPTANVLFRATAFRRAGSVAPIPSPPGAWSRLWWRWTRRLASARAAPGRW